jgi:HD-like signal output (HDOD) protein
VVPTAKNDPGALAARVGSLPPMPRAAARVLALINDPDASAEQIGRIIETDPALAGAVLRLVNSALFGLSQPVASLSQALVLIGFLRLRSLMLATVAAGLKDLIPPIAADARDRVWEHSVTIGLGARALAQRLGFEWGEEAFVSGLLHDCGRLVLLARCPEYLQVLRTSERNLPPPEQERQALGVEHAEVGAALLEHWKQSQALVLSARLHHGEAPPEGLFQPLVAIVMLSELLLENPKPPEPCEASRVLGLSAADLPVIAEVITREVAEARASLMGL